MRGLQRLVSCLLPSNAARTMALQRSPLFRCRLFLTPNALLSTCNAAQFPSSLSPLASPDVQHLLAELETNRALQEEFVLSLSDHARRSISIIGASAEDRSQANAAALDAVLDTVRRLTFATTPPALAFHAAVHSTRAYSSLNICDVDDVTYTHARAHVCVCVLYIYIYIEQG